MSHLGEIYYRRMGRTSWARRSRWLMWRSSPSGSASFGSAATIEVPFTIQEAFPTVKGLEMPEDEEFKRLQRWWDATRSFAQRLASCHISSRYMIIVTTRGSSRAKDAVQPSKPPWFVSS